MHLYKLEPSTEEWQLLAAGATNRDGRCVWDDGIGVWVGMTCTTITIINIMHTITTCAPHSIGDLLPASHALQPGPYRITFNTTAYMAKCKAMHPTFFADVPFYPRAEIYFEVAPNQVHEHFHVPLTWNPYGYSTYRGS